MDRSNAEIHSASTTAAVGVACPVCASRELDPIYPEYQGPCITSDYAVLSHAALANRCCRGCGLVFNARGTRGDTDAFYRDSYNLMMRRQTAAIQSFSGAQPMSQAQKSCHVLLELSKVEDSGRMLEIGAGKGEFLTHFLTVRPDWSVVAVEPSAAAQTLLTVPGITQVVHGGFTDYDARPGSFDLVVALGVLEHVENPLHLMRSMHEALRPGGVLFLRVPNFARNPNDLFCADHLSKLTIHTLRGLGLHCGFSVDGEREEGVPVFIALRKQEGAGTAAVPNAYLENSPIAHANASIAESGINAVVAARAAALAKNEAFAVFGLGASGLFAPFWAHFPPDEIAAYIDENTTIWGTEVHGRPVGGLDYIEKLSIRHVALAVSPVYVAKIREKLAPFGVQVYAGS